MKVIGKDDVLFGRLSKDIYIVSSSIRSFNIFVDNKDDKLIIEIDFKLLYNLDSILKLRFVGIKEYSFSWNSTHSFYYIETYKLIKKENHFYISFDPEDEVLSGISENDRDFILFGSFEGYLI